MLCRTNLTHPSPRLDPPRGEEYWIPTDPRFKHAVDLVSYIRSGPEFSDTFSIGVAGHFAVFARLCLFLNCSIGYPDGHTDNEGTEDDEIEHLKAKVDAGADYIVTQLFYDVDNFIRWIAKVRQRGLWK